MIGKTCEKGMRSARMKCSLVEDVVICVRNRRQACDQGGTRTRSDSVQGYNIAVTHTIVLRGICHEATAYFF